MDPGVLVYAFSLLFDKSATVGTTRADETTTPTIHRQPSTRHLLRSHACGFAHGLAGRR